MNLNGREGKLDRQSRPFFYPSSMLSADRKHGIRGQGLVVSSQGLGSRSSNHDILCRARLQASSITKDGVLADLISEQILMYYAPSIINHGCKESCGFLEPWRQCRQEMKDEHIGW